MENFRVNNSEKLKQSFVLSLDPYMLCEKLAVEKLNMMARCLT